MEKTDLEPRLGSGGVGRNKGPEHFVISAESSLVPQEREKEMKDRKEHHLHQLSTVTPISQWKTLRNREGKHFVTGHTVSKCRNRDSHPCQVDSLDSFSSFFFLYCLAPCSQSPEFRVDKGEVCSATLA